MRQMPVVVSHKHIFHSQNILYSQDIGNQGIDINGCQEDTAGMVWAQ